MPDDSWLDTLHVVEESSKAKGGAEGSLFYIREKNHRPGYSYQSTALTREAAEGVIKRLKAARALESEPDERAGTVSKTVGTA